LSKRSRKAARADSQTATTKQPAPLELSRGALETSPKGRLRWLILWAGWLLPQIVLLGPALIGRTVDLPVDLLAFPGAYLPDRPEYAEVQHHGREVFDLVLLYPGAREFSANELRAGRLPLWQPANFAGAPFAYWPKYSPFELLYYVAPYPVTLGWMALLQAVTVGLGMWMLLSRCFKLSYWSSALGSWCAPFTGFITVWHGSLPLGPVLWLPWSLWAVHGVVKNPSASSGLAVALVTALLLLAGHPGMGGLVLLTTGLYFVWMLGTELLVCRQWRLALSATAVVGVGWLIGFLIGAPYLLPLLEYGRTGVRMDARAEGYDERPPEGLEGLPAILWPEVNGGETHVNSVRIAPHSNLTEGASGAYAGLLAALWLAPLAWRHRRLRSQAVFLTLLVVVSVGWALNVPGIVHVLRSGPLRPLASLSFNRWVFATADAILILAAIGFDSLLASVPKFRRWWAIPIVATAGFGGWCLYRFFGITQEMEDQGFTICFVLGIAISLAGLAGWATTFRAGPRIKWLRIGLICLLPLELFWFAWTERRQADIALYFPPVPILDKLVAEPAGRIWGAGCFQPNLNQMVGLEDVRGYDGVDPRDYVKLLDLAVDHSVSPFLFYARTQSSVPTAWQSADGLKLHPVADLLNVRYLIFRSRPPEGLPVILHEDDYWITENRGALPRAFVPRSAHSVKDDAEAVALMTPVAFDPRQTVVLSDDLQLPDAMQGTASVHYVTPTRSELDVDMQTPGLVVVSDLWDAGWRAELDGSACPIYRVDLALRGIQVRAGKHRIVCTYEPRSVRIGFYAAGVGCCLLLLWTIWQVRAARRLRSAAS
ncbi:MAG TPA: hypothetical protein VFG04_08365, partial [Planctomycetaceae bacterium]|jgi:hypothetical protein|nr:hypothetical protein [Planctomycetaceae bacterium]